MKTTSMLYNENELSFTLCRIGELRDEKKWMQDNGYGDATEDIDSEIEKYTRELYDICPDYHKARKDAMRVMETGVDDKTWGKHVCVRSERKDSVSFLLHYEGYSYREFSYCDRGNGYTSFWLN